MIKNKHILKVFANASLLVFAITVISLNAGPHWPDMQADNNCPKLEAITADWPEITPLASDWPDINGK